MIEVKIGSKKTKEIKDGAVTAFKIRALLEASDEAKLQNPNAPFEGGDMRRVKWEHTRFKLDFYHRGQKIEIMDGSIYDLGVALVESDSEYLDVRYPETVFVESADGTTGSITVTLKLPSTIVCKGKDKLVYTLYTYDRVLGKMQYDYANNSIVQINGTYYIPNLREDKGKTWATKDGSRIQVIPEYDHNDAIMSTIPKINIENIEQGADFYADDIGSNINEIHFLNMNSNKVQDIDIINAEEVRYIENVNLDADRFQRSTDYNDILNLYRMHNGLDMLAAHRHGHVVVYKDSVEDLDKTRIDITMNGKRNKEGMTKLIIISFLTSGTLIESAISQKEAIQKKTIRKSIMNSNGLK